MPALAGEIAIVTGAGRGFGRAIAERLASEGAAVALIARNKAQLDEAVAGIRQAGGEAIALCADVTDPADVDRAVSQVEAELGAPTILINNAGVPGPIGPIWELDMDAWWAAQQVHIRAPMLFLRRLLPSMVERDRGRIVIVSAIAARKVAPYLSAYCTGKIAQNRIVEEAAAELADTGVKIFAIDPGFVFTSLARDTMNAPAAQKWLPGMVARLKEVSDGSETAAGLARCAQRCLDLVSGRYDSLSGRYLEIPDDLDAIVASLPA
ncbi:putative oxidoreductase [Sphingobium sp. SYK-6]|uniref:SDR family NAD(P)-dependent oxidoreductase n=1 Tax=Sphingobium sp. (strain NBRC 103272 / SYK-6) TaxID=627192 RepID=UPI0002277F5A|nr:SDR family oxidoreductase [Sphingobium sp. SYK-6]BAK68482.1 putative oxidoreductase [Sphingobium sp. SYK-6]